MGLMGTLAKIAIGYAAARGVDRLTKPQPGLIGGSAQLKGEHPASAPTAQMGQAMSGKMPDMPQMPNNPLNSMMETFKQGGLGAMMQGMGEGNPMADMMKKVQNGTMDLNAMMGSAGTGLAGMLTAAAATQGKTASAMLDAFNTKQTNPQGEEMAGLMLRAMIQAAKADGGIDAAEKAKILETLGDDADAEDKAFIKTQLAAKVDPETLAADTPAALRTQVYSASLMTITVDTAAEAQYLDSLAKAMELDEPTVNALHMQMGLQPLYA
ncbi:DUF533 domain-containing protein [Tropicibacter sp. S64]|uniref:DUF533 domain-containing protein n=1 Tax=Tropicibacter sp. S64 TaxID=3415122 RepID=UPI003C7A107B